MLAVRRCIAVAVATITRADRNPTAASTTDRGTHSLPSHLWQEHLAPLRRVASIRCPYRSRRPRASLRLRPLDELAADGDASEGHAGRRPVRLVSGHAVAELVSTAHGAPSNSCPIA